ncbi:MAG: hypothetical protein M1317_01685 [Candidatus Thermoplasmatota archaeon]|nr:hypothetical protein [Candidatus Thermoplasmatota archaeon]
MPEIYVKDEIYRNISESHGDVSKFVNMMLAQYVNTYSDSSNDGIDHYRTHGNGD